MKVNSLIRGMINKNYTELKLSTEFEKVFELNGLKNLSELLKYTINEMQNLKGFNYRILHELIGFLEKNNVKNLLIEK